MSPSRRSVGQVRAHLDHARRGRRAAGGPVEGPVEIRHLDDVVAPELLLGFGEGPVLHLALPVSQADRRGARRRLESGAADHHPGLGQGLRVRPVGAPVGVFSLLVAAGAEIGLGLVDQDRVLHGLAPSLRYCHDGRAPCFSTSGWMSRGRGCRTSPPTRMTTAAGSQIHMSSLAMTCTPQWLKNAPIPIGETTIGRHGKKYRSAENGAKKA